MNDNLRTRSLLWHVLVLLFISVVVFLLSYFQASVTLWQQVIVLLIAVSLFTFHKISNIRVKRFATTPLQWAFIYLCLMIVQLIIYSSGGLYSPFFILLHISTLALSFLVSLPIAMLFLIFSIVNLLLDIALDSTVQGFIQNSLAGAILYVASIVAIVPLAWYIAKQYRLKEALSNTLAQQVNLGQTILSNVQEYVFITDKQLNVLSANPPVELGLHLYLADIVNRPLLDSIILKNAQGKIVDVDAFSIQEIRQNKQGRTIQHLRLYAKNLLPISVQVHVQPIKDESGEVEQFIVIITNQEKNVSQVTESIASQARLKHQAQIQDLMGKLHASGKHDLLKQLMFAETILQDVLLVADLQQTGITKRELLTDVAQTSERMVAAMSPIIALLGVALTFELPNFQPKSEEKLMLNGEVIEPSVVTGPYFTVPLDPKWFSILLQKIIELSSYKVAGLTNASVSVALVAETDSLTLIVKAFAPQMESNAALGNEPMSFQYGSGLEQYLVDAIMPHLPIGAQEGRDETAGAYVWRASIFKPIAPRS